MGSVISNRKTAEALRKTLQHLESDPTVDSSDPAFVNLKCYLLQRVLELEYETAETQASIHLVESSGTESSEPAPAKTSGDRAGAPEDLRSSKSNLKSSSVQ